MTKMIAFLRRILGYGEFRVADPGDTISERAYAVRAWSDDATISITTTKGDDLPQGPLQQGTSLTGEFEKVSVDGSSAGSVLVYLL